MTLRRKTLLIVTVVVFSLIASLYILTSNILLNGFAQVEDQDTQGNVERALDALSASLSSLDSKTGDWANWDDAYNFVMDGNPEFIKTNPTDTSFVQIRLNLMVFVNTSGETVYAKAFDLDKQQEQPFPHSFISHLSADSPLLHYPDLETGLKGIVLLPEGPLLIASRPILTSDGNGPSHGTVIFGRFLDAAEIKTLAETTHLTLSVERFNDSKLPLDFEQARSTLSDSTPIYVNPVNSTEIAGYTLLRDIDGKPALLLRAKLPRRIYAQAQVSTRYLLGSLAVVGLILFLVTQKRIGDLVLSALAGQETEKRYRAVVEQTSEGIFLLDLQTLRVLEANIAFQALLGYSSAEVVGLSIYDFVVSNQEGIEDHPQQSGAEKSTEFRESQYRRKDGSRVNVEISSSLIRYGGRQVSCIVIRDISERKRAQEQLLHNAFYDTLTGLPNRALFADRLGRALERAKRIDPCGFAVLFLDLDRFKLVNDSLGHTVGDQLLMATALRLEASLRSMDTVARLGGDEFAILLEEVGGIQEAIRVADRIQSELALPFDLGGHRMFHSASIGIVLSEARYERPEEVLRDADIAMYQAKAHGKAQYKVFDTAMRDRAIARLDMETDLRSAVERQEFQIHYQPIVSLERSGRIIGFEALVRWQHPSRGVVSPMDFIPMAEETGLILPLGKWVLREACRQMRAWQAQFPLVPPLTISVNFSARQFTQLDLTEQIEQILQETGLDARSLRLEITESVIMEDRVLAANLIRQLRTLGVQVQIDDFGTGYSSLNYLQQFPIDTIKIDRSFISKLGVHGNRSEIVRTIVLLAQEMGLKVVAEGVETSEQLTQLKTFGCDYAQGYLFCKPLERKAADTLVAGWHASAIEMSSGCSVAAPSLCFQGIERLDA